MEMTVHDINHIVFVNKCNSKMDKASYESNMEILVVKPSEKSVLDYCDNEEYWPQNNHQEFMWCDFQGVMLHVSYKMKDHTRELIESLFNVIICLA